MESSLLPRGVGTSGRDSKLQSCFCTQLVYLIWGERGRRPPLLCQDHS